jgi:hypothetical protein
MAGLVPTVSGSHPQLNPPSNTAGFNPNPKVTGSDGAQLAADSTRHFK